MKHQRVAMGTIALGILAVFLVVPVIAAQSGGGYDLSWWSVDGGGGTVSGRGPSGPYSLSGTIGQPDAGVITGGGYTLSGGWQGVPEPPVGYDFCLYLPLVQRGW
jgi:hypothetical protein